jgi:hypothetical protein
LLDITTVIRSPLPTIGKRRSLADDSSMRLPGGIEPPVFRVTKKID